MRRDVFQAIADPVRREIFDILSKESLSVNEVAEHFNVNNFKNNGKIELIHLNFMLKN